MELPERREREMESHRRFNSRRRFCFGSPASVGFDTLYPHAPRSNVSVCYSVASVIVEALTRLTDTAICRIDFTSVQYTAALKQRAQQLHDQIRLYMEVHLLYMSEHMLHGDRGKLSRGEIQETRF